MTRSPSQSVGGVGASERPFPLYTPGSNELREAVTYDPSGFWIVLVLLLVLFVVAFGFVLLIR